MRAPAMAMAGVLLGAAAITAGCGSTTSGQSPAAAYNACVARVNYLFDNHGGLSVPLHVALANCARTPPIFPSPGGFPTAVAP